MARNARRYDVFLPLTDNDGRAFPDAAFESQQRQFPYRGIWQDKTQLYFDQIVVMTTLDFRRSGSSRFVAKLKEELKREFQQLEILITESALRVH